MGSKDKKIAEITEINKVFDLKELVKSNARFKLETLEKEINNVVNLYSEMLEYIKENSGEKIKLFNNLSKKDVDNLDKKINEIIIADTSDKYSKKSGVIVEYKLKNKIPYVKKDEKILIAPFVEIVKKEIKKDKVVITIKKDDYKELKTKELKDLKGIIEREFASYKKEIKEYFKLKEEKKKATKEMKAKEVIINSYEENVFKYLEAKLKAQEAKIEKQKMQEKKKEEEKIKQKEIEDFMVLAKENGEKLEKIRAKLNSTHKALVDNEEYYRSACKDLDIDFKSNLGRTTIKVKKLAIENTLNDLLKETDDKNILVKDLKDVKKKIENKTKGINNTIDLLNIDKDVEEKSYVSKYQEEIRKQIAENLYFRVNLELYSALDKEYIRKRNELANTRIGFIGKILGKRELQNVKVTNYNLKVGLLRKEKVDLEKRIDPKAKKEYKISDIIVDLYDAKINTFDGRLPESLNDLYRKILAARLDGEVYTEEKLKDLLEFRIDDRKKLLPVVYGEKSWNPFTRVKDEVFMVKNENAEIKKESKYQEENGVKVEKSKIPEVVEEYENLLAKIIVEIVDEDVKSMEIEEETKKKIDEILKSVEEKIKA